VRAELNVLNTKKEDAQSYVESPLLPTEPQDSTSSIKKHRPNINISQNKMQKKHYITFNYFRTVNKKPEKEMYGKLNNELINSRPEHVTMQEMALKCVNGSIFISAELDTTYIKRRTKDTFRSSTVLTLDADKVPNLEVLKEAVKDNASFLYETFSSTKENPRCRIIYQLKKPIANYDLYRRTCLHIAKNLERKVTGLEIDRQSMDALHIFLPGQDLHVFDYNNEFDNEHLNSALIHEIVEDKRKSADKKVQALSSNNIYVFTHKEIEKMIDCLGYIEDRDVWIKCGMALKKYAKDGFISDQEGYELWSKHNDKDKNTWDKGLNNIRSITIGSLTHYAREKGYVAPNKLDNASIDCVSFQYKSYISEHNDLLDSIITSEQRLLVDAPTGSGKTFSFIDAMKRQEVTYNTVYVFFTPYRALTEQVGREYNVTAIVGNDGKKVDENKLFNTVKEALNQNKRVFVLTYDMAKPFQNIIGSLRKENTKFHCVVDEWHKIQDDYNYRGAAIRNLLSFLKDCKTVIALSGTTQEIDVSNFEQKIVFTPIEPRDTFDSFLVVKTKEKKGYLSEVAYLIENLKTKLNNKTLLFLNNMKELKLLWGALSKRGIKASVLNSASKRSDVYRSITEEGTIPNDIDVILTTNVIADGVSIKNDHNFSVIVVSHENSPIYKATQIKQMSHRLRNKYNHFILYALNKEPKENSKLIEPHTHYHWLKEVAEELRQEMAIYQPGRFYASVLERDCAIYQENDEVKVDNIRLRHQSYSRFDYSMRFRTDVFVKTVENILKQQIKSVGTVRSIVERWENEEVLSDYKEAVQSLKEIQELEEKEKLEQFPKVYDEHMHIAVTTSDEELLRELKKSIHHRHYKALLSIAPLTDFETSSKLIGRVKKDAQIHEYSNMILNLIEVIGFKAGTVDNKTKKVLSELSLHIGKEYSNEEINDVVKGMAKRFKAQQSSIKKLLNFFVVKGDRKTVSGVRLRTKTLKKLIDIEHVKEQFGISTEAVIYSLEKGVDILIKKDNKTIFKVPVTHEIELTKRRLK